MSSLRTIVIRDGERMQSEASDVAGRRQVVYGLRLNSAIAGVRNRFRMPSRTIVRAIEQGLQQDSQLAEWVGGITLDPGLSDLVDAARSWPLQSARQTALLAEFVPGRLLAHGIAGKDQSSSTVEPYLTLERLEYADPAVAKRRRHDDLARRLLPRDRKDDRDLAETLSNVVATVESLTRIIDGRLEPIPFYARLISADLGPSPDGETAVLKFEWFVAVKKPDGITLLDSLTAEIASDHDRVDPETLLPHRDWLVDVIVGHGTNRNAPAGWRFIPAVGDLHPKYPEGLFVSGQRKVTAAYIRELLARALGRISPVRPVMAPQTVEIASGKRTGMSAHIRAFFVRALGRETSGDPAATEFSAHLSSVQPLDDLDAPGEPDFRGEQSHRETRGRGRGSNYDRNGARRRIASRRQAGTPATVRGIHLARTAASIAASCGKPMSSHYVALTARSVWSMLETGERKLIVGWRSWRSASQGRSNGLTDAVLLRRLATLPMADRQLVLRYPAIFEWIELSGQFEIEVGARASWAAELDPVRRKILAGLTLKQVNSRHRGSQAVQLLRTCAGEEYDKIPVHRLLCDFAALWKASPRQILRRLDSLRAIEFIYNPREIEGTRSHVPARLIRAVGSNRGKKAESLIQEITGLLDKAGEDLARVARNDEAGRIGGVILGAITAGRVLAKPGTDIGRLRENVAALLQAAPWRSLIARGAANDFRIATPADLDHIREALGRDIDGIVLIANDMSEAAKLNLDYSAPYKAAQSSAPLSSIGRISVQPIPLGEEDWWSDVPQLPEQLGATSLLDLKLLGVDLDVLGLPIDVADELGNRLAEWHRQHRSRNRRSRVAAEAPFLSKSSFSEGAHP